MRPYLPILAVILSCVSEEADGTSPGGTDPGTSAPAPPAYGADGTDSDRSGACDLTVEYEAGDLSVEMPVECDPFYFYTGDPPPDSVRSDPGEEAADPETERFEGAEDDGLEPHTF